MIQTIIFLFNLIDIFSIFSNQYNVKEKCFLLFKSGLRIVFHVHKSLVHECYWIQFFFWSGRHIKEGFFSCRYIFYGVFYCCFEIECLNECSFFQSLCISDTLDLDALKQGVKQLHKKIKFTLCIWTYTEFWMFSDSFFDDFCYALKWRCKLFHFIMT